MSLADVQAALARLVTDSEARAAFREDPAAAARGLGLPPDEVGSLALSLDKFAGSLKAKRRLDAAKMLPLTALALEPDFGRVFRAGLTEPAPGTGEDALGFVRRLARAPDPQRPWLADLARYEAGFIETREGGLRLRKFHYPVGEIARALETGAAISPRRRFTVAIWMRLPGGRLFHRVLPG